MNKKIRKFKKKIRKFKGRIKKFKEAILNPKSLIVLILVSIITTFLSTLVYDTIYGNIELNEKFEKVTEENEKIHRLLLETNITIEDAKLLITNLDYKKGEESVYYTINQWHRNNKISDNDKVFLESYSYMFFFTLAEIDNNIKNKNQIDFFTQIRYYYLNNNPSKIKDLYFKKQDVFSKKNKVETLYLLISLTQNLFNYITTSAFYEELLIIDSRTLHFHQYANHLMKYQNEKKALVYYKKCIKEYENEKDYYQLANIYENIAHIHHTFNTYDKAIEYYTYAYEIRSKYLQKNYKELERFAWTVTHLGNVFYDFKKYDEAIGNYNYSLNLFSELHKQTGDIKYLSLIQGQYSNLSNTYSRLMKYEKALSYNKLALDYLNKELRLESNNANSIQFLYNKASILMQSSSIYSEIGKKELANINYKESVEIFSTLYSSNPFVYVDAYARSLNNYSSFLTGFNHKYEKAKHYSEQAERIYQDLYIKSPTKYSLSYANTLSLLASINRNLNNFNKAKYYFKKSLKIYELNSNNIPSIIYNKKYAITLGHLSTLYSKEFKIVDAIDASTKAIELYYISNSMYSVSIEKKNLALLYAQQGDFIKAINLFEKSINIHKSLGFDNINESVNIELANKFNNYGFVLLDNNKLEKGYKTLNESLEIYERFNVDGINDYSISLVKNNLGLYYYKKEKYKKAIQCFLQSLKIKKTYLETSPNFLESNIAHTLFNLANAYKHIDRKLAIRYYKEALNTYKRLSSNNPIAYDIYYAELIVLGIELNDKSIKQTVSVKQLLSKYKEACKKKKILMELERITNANKM